MLSEKIKKYRLDNNLTQEEFAAKLFVTRNAVSKWENDNGYPSIDTIKEIAKLLNISIDELLGSDDVRTIAINTNERLNRYKNYASNVLVFISYALIAIVIPHVMFYFDPTSVIAYCFFIGTISFIILGLVTPFFNKNMLHSFIASALAITPILIYFEILYYVLFVISYCLMLKLQKINLKNNINKMIKSISLGMLIFFSIAYVVLCIISFITYDESYSAPIYTQASFYTIIFIIPIIASLLIYIIFKKKS